MTDAQFQTKYGPWGIVAGASEGLGAAFAAQLAARGLNVLAIARRQDKLKALTSGLVEKYGVEARALVLDLASESLASKVTQEIQDLGSLKIGLLVYNAAVASMGPFLDLPLEDHLRTLNVNCRAPLLLAHTLGPDMIRRGCGGMILMSSLTAFHGSPLIAHYSATKAFNLVLAEGLWDELRAGGVDVLACCAGATRTPNYEASLPPGKETGGPMVLEPEEVARQAISALGKGPSVITGLGNRLAGLLMHRIFPRRLAITTMGRTLRSMYTPQDKG